MGEHPVKLLVMATMLEAKPFVAGLSMEKTAERPFPVFQSPGRILIISGIGKTRAAMTTCYGCLTFHPESVWNAGAAGALSDNCQTGSIYQIHKIIEHDRPHLLTRRPVTHTPNFLKRPGDMPKAVLASGDCPVLKAEDRRRLATSADLADMEAAAVVQVCSTFKTPCHVFKFVSDTPGHTASATIIANIRRFRTPFFEYIRTLWNPSG